MFYKDLTETNELLQWLQNNQRWVNNIWWQEETCSFKDSSETWSNYQPWKWRNLKCVYSFIQHCIINYDTGSGRNTWWFGNTNVSGTVGMGNLSLSALLARQAFHLPWSAGLYSIGLSLWRRISKTILSFWLSGYFIGTSIFIGTTVSLLAALSRCGWETSE